MIYQSTYLMRFFLHPTFSIINIVPKLAELSTSYNNTFCYLNWCSDTLYTVMEPFWSHIVNQCKCYETLRISAIFYNDIVIQAILSIIFKLNIRMASGASILCQVIHSSGWYKYLLQRKHTISSTKMKISISSYINQTRVRLDYVTIQNRILKLVLTLDLDFGIGLWNWSLDSDLDLDCDNSDEQWSTH